jgi:hypothetical protein
MPVTASAEASHRSSATARFGVSAAYLLNEADIAPCGRDSAALRPFLSAATEKHCPCRNSGCTLSRAPLDQLNRTSPDEGDNLNGRQSCRKSLETSSDHRGREASGQRRWRGEAVRRAFPICLRQPRIQARRSNTQAQADPAHAFFLETTAEASTSLSARHGTGRRGSLA